MKKSMLLPNRKPRNPLVAVAAFRRAGRHRPSEKSRRQGQRLALRRAVEETKAQTQEQGF